MNHNYDAKFKTDSSSHPLGTSAGAVEDAYWSANYLKRPYVELDRAYTDYRPAYQYAWESRVRFGNRPFRDVESDLERGWELARGESRLAWAQAKHATSDAWRRLERAGPAAATRGCN